MKINKNVLLLLLSFLCAQGAWKIEACEPAPRPSCVNAWVVSNGTLRYCPNINDHRDGLGEARYFEVRKKTDALDAHFASGAYALFEAIKSQIQQFAADAKEKRKAWFACVMCTEKDRGPEKTDVMTSVWESNEQDIAFISKFTITPTKKFLWHNKWSGWLDRWGDRGFMLSWLASIGSLSYNFYLDQPLQRYTKISLAVLAASTCGLCFSYLWKRYIRYASGIDPEKLIRKGQSYIYPFDHDITAFTFRAHTQDTNTPNAYRRD